MQAVPVLRIRDIIQSERFYCDALGFRADWRWRDGEGSPVFMQISRDNIRLYLTEDSACEFGGLVYLYVDDVDNWYADNPEKRDWLRRLVPGQTLGQP